VLAITIISTHIVYQKRDGEIELARVTWSNARTYLLTVTYLSNNPTKRQVNKYRQIHCVRKLVAPYRYVNVKSLILDVLL